ncbi:MAG: translation initiation factor IF-2 N-terminal domain-containing protein [Eubacterium callanderi]
MSKLRVYQLASEYDVPSKEFVDILNKHNIPVKNHMSVLTEQQVTDFRKEYSAQQHLRRTGDKGPEASAAQKFLATKSTRVQQQSANTK